MGVGSKMAQELPRRHQGRHLVVTLTNTAKATRLVVVHISEEVFPSQRGNAPSPSLQARVNRRGCAHSIQDAFPMAQGPLPRLRAAFAAEEQARFDTEVSGNVLPYCVGRPTQK